MKCNSPSQSLQFMLALLTRAVPIMLGYECEVTIDAWGLSRNGEAPL